MTSAHREWIDADGIRVVIDDGRISLYGLSSTGAGREVALSTDTERVLRELLRGSIAERVSELRELLRGDEPLPDWTPEQWIAVLTATLGDAATSLHSGLENAPPTRARVLLGAEKLMAVAAVCLDAVEQLEGER